MVKLVQFFRIFMKNFFCIRHRVIVWWGIYYLRIALVPKGCFALKGMERKKLGAPKTLIFMTKNVSLKCGSTHKGQSKNAYYVNFGLLSNSKLLLRTKNVQCTFVRTLWVDDESYNATHATSHQRMMGVDIQMSYLRKFLWQIGKKRPK